MPHYNLLENKFTHITAKLPVGILQFLLEKKNHNITSFSLKSHTIQIKAFIKLIRSQK